MVPEDKLQEFVTRARQAAGPNIESMILFGSAVSGDFHPGHSDLNLFCVLHDSSFTALQALAPAVKWWNKQKQPPPLCMTRHELERSTDVFTIELLDMVEHHRVLYGEGILGLRIPTHQHRVHLYRLQPSCRKRRRYCTFSPIRLAIRLRWICEVPAAIVAARESRKWRSMSNSAE